MCCDAGCDDYECTCPEPNNSSYAEVLDQMKTVLFHANEKATSVKLEKLRDEINSLALQTCKLDKKMDEILSILNEPEVNRKFNAQAKANY